MQVFVSLDHQRLRFRGQLDRQNANRVRLYDRTHRVGQFESGRQLNVPELKRRGVRFSHGDLRCASDLEALPSTD
jgi:hypothetical protein